jgi:hypothetical protein
MAADKIQRDLNYQRQLETLPQPDSAPQLGAIDSQEVSRLEEMQRELDTAKAEAKRWKLEFGRREGKVGGMESRIKELESRVGTIQPTIDVRAITGRDPSEPLTGQEIISLMMQQSAAFGNTIRQVKEELQSQGSSNEPGLPLDLEAELVESHPWLTDLPRPQKLRAMQDILGQAGVSIAPQAPPGTAHPTTTSSLPAAAKAPVRQAPYTEPSNRGSLAEQRSVIPERQAFNDKVQNLQAILNGPYKPGQTERAAELLASLGAGPVDDSQQGVFRRR